MSAPKAKEVRFSPAEMRRLRLACQGLGITYEEFVRFAVMQAVTELEGYAREEYQRPPRTNGNGKLEE